MPHRLAYCCCLSPLPPSAFTTPSLTSLQGLSAALEERERVDGPELRRWLVGMQVRIDRVWMVGWLQA